MARPTPRLARAIPSNPVTRPDTGIPVIATLHWNDGQTTEVAALATAWTRDAVEITWTWGPRTREPRSDWIPAEHVRRWRPEDLRHPTPPPAPLRRLGRRAVVHRGVLLGGREHQPSARRMIGGI